MSTIIDLPRTISVNALWRIAGKRLIKSEAYKSWLTECGWEIRRQKAVPVKGRYRLQLEALKHNDRKRDVGNLIKAAEDLLVHMQIIEDDSLGDEVNCKWVTSGPALRLVITSIEE
jgi:Holliday junction resolvase RusA-like endonuclease